MKVLQILESTNLSLHDYKEGERVTVINSPSTRSLVGKELFVVKQVRDIDGKYVIVRTAPNASGFSIEAPVKVTLIDSVSPE